MDFFKIIILAVAFIILALLFIVLFKKKKAVAVIMLVSVLVLCTLGLLLFNTVFYNNSNKVTITDEYNKDVSIEVENHLLHYEYTNAQFSSKLNLDEIQNSLKSQYDNVFYDTELEQIVFTNNNMIYTIKLYEHNKFLWSDRYKYIFSANIVGLEGHSVHVEVPFPYEAIDESVDVFDTEMKLKCDYEKVKTYYTSFTNAEFGDNTILLTYDNYKVEIIFKDNFVKIDIIDD